MGPTPLHPNDSVARIADEVVVETGRTIGRSFAKWVNKVSSLLRHVEVKQVVADRHAIADELDGDVHLNSVVVNSARLPLTTFDSVKFLSLAHPSADESVVTNFVIRHPDR